jgi:hypothetical protein
MQTNDRDARCGSGAHTAVLPRQVAWLEWITLIVEGRRAWRGEGLRLHLNAKFRNGMRIGAVRCWLSL